MNGGVYGGGVSRLSNGGGGVGEQLVHSLLTYCFDCNLTWTLLGFIHTRL